MGMTGTAEWAQPILEFLADRERVNGTPPCFTSPRINHLWQLESADAAPYSTTRRKHSLLCLRHGEANRESYTLRSPPPKNLSPTAANQMNFNRRELNIIGHWASSSKMPDRYDRAVCATELLLRNTIIQKVVSGWELAASFHLPLTVPGGIRIGKDVDDTLDPAPTGDPSDPSTGVEDDAQVIDTPIATAAIIDEPRDSQSRDAVG